MEDLTLQQLCLTYLLKRPERTSHGMTRRTNTLLDEISRPQVKSTSLAHQIMCNALLRFQVTASQSLCTRIKHNAIAAWLLE